MELSTLFYTIRNFINNVELGWTEKYGLMERNRVPIEQADRNTARLRSGTYTDSQLKEFNRRLSEAERNNTKAYFPGDAKALPDTLGLLACSECGCEFRSCLDDATKCFDCTLLEICPYMPGGYFRGWYNHDVWQLEMNGDIMGYHGEMMYWVSAPEDGGNVGARTVTTKRDKEGRLTEIRFWFKAYYAGLAGTIVWQGENLDDKHMLPPVPSMMFGAPYGRDHIRDAKAVEFEGLFKHLALSTWPSWLVAMYRPRELNPFAGKDLGPAGRTD